MSRNEIDMKSNPWLVARFLGLVLPLAYSCTAPAPTGDGRLFVPEDLPASPHEGEAGDTLKMIAFTLAEGPTGLEFFMAVRNDGNAPGCLAGVLADFVDKNGQTVASVGGGLLGDQLFYYAQDDVILNCLSPGQTGMSASRGFAEGVAIGDVAAVDYRFPRFGLDGIVPLEGIVIGALATHPAGTGATYTGTLTNGSKMAIHDPAITVFATNRVGRPLDAATSVGTVELAPADAWSFETSPVANVGVDRAVYATVNLSK
jgi:hypothetical protein